MDMIDKPENLKELFAGRHFNRDVIILCGAAMPLQ
jgi:hypothetical protein